MLWGAPPFWVYWDLFKKDNAGMTQARSKGLLVDEKFFPSVEPLEYWLPRLPYPTVIAHGTLDPYSPASFRAYLMSLLGGKSQFSFRWVAGAIHEVSTETTTPDIIEDYLRTLLSN